MLISFSLFNGGFWKESNDEKTETYLRLISVGEEADQQLQEFGAKTRALLGFYYYREKSVPDGFYEEKSVPDDACSVAWLRRECWWNNYYFLFEFLWFQKKIEIYGKTFREAIYTYVTWKEVENN